MQAIPTEPNGGNHTALFTAAARGKEAHEATLVVTKMLAHVGMKVLQDDGFLEKVSPAYRNWRYSTLIGRIRLRELSIQRADS